MKQNIAFSVLFSLLGLQMVQAGGGSSLPTLVVIAGKFLAVENHQLALFPPQLSNGDTLDVGPGEGRVVRVERQGNTIAVEATTDLHRFLKNHLNLLGDPTTVRFKLTHDHQSSLAELEEELLSGRPIKVYLSTAPEAVVLYEFRAGEPSSGVRSEFCTVRRGRALTLVLATLRGFLPMIQEAPGKLTSLFHEAPSTGPIFSGDCEQARQIYDSLN